MKQFKATTWVRLKFLVGVLNILHISRCEFISPLHYRGIRVNTVCDRKATPISAGKPNLIFGSNCNSSLLCMIFNYCIINASVDEPTSGSDASSGNNIIASTPARTDFN